MKKRLILLIVTLILFAAAPFEVPDLRFGSLEELQAFYVWSPERIPVISAHRGGPCPGFPENCIETFENLLLQIPATLEVDIAMTADSVLILMHDNTLDRTSTGSGRISETEYRELQDLFLEDNAGQLTEYRIPTLEASLLWARGKTVLNLDVKRGVPFEKVVEHIHRTQSEASVTVIVYNIEDAVRVHRLDPGLMLSVSIRNEEELQRVKDAGIPMNRVTAFTGTQLHSKKLYRLLHEEKVFVNLGTLGNLDKKAEARGDRWYRRWERMGVDIFSSDRPLEVARTLYSWEGDAHE
ncbi:MAG: glycerophosphodiester phosphodiesterase family protein [Candidatus Marinimicrobia bacterium]|nr:glycerophosphodiester phosphodiesterase family protein [Candidatus Neomarinimicrobiota bacterium]MDD5710088.1 glycerophosphodiester phosphodiesterase family protein [Candidatus Neomarinimicrobiota bacterium]MDX9778327.1 glycerophosphodiester phosphodiesterase family protein [bacterium]